MTVHQVAGPLIFFLALGDLILHVILDIKKTRETGNTRASSSDIDVPRMATGAATLSTLLFFLIIFLLSVSWFIPPLHDFLVFVRFIEPGWLSQVVGLALFFVGVFLNGWSRFVRKNMASSWGMREEHRLITTGPYAWIRHPSYASYFIGIIGVILLLPSLLTFFLLIAIPAYYTISIHEEQLLLSKFGNEYKTYMKQTGRFTPSL